MQIESFPITLRRTPLVSRHPRVVGLGGICFSRQHCLETPSMPRSLPRSMAPRTAWNRRAKTLFPGLGCFLWSQQPTRARLIVSTCIFTTLPAAHQGTTIRQIFSCQATTTPTSADVLPSRIGTGGVRGIDGRSRARLLCASNLSLSSTPPALIALRKTRNPPWRKPYTAILGPVWIFHETGHDRAAPRPALLHPRVPCLGSHGPYSPNLSPSPPSILVSGMEGPTCQPFRPCSGLGDGEYIYIMSTRLGDAQLCPARVSPQQRLL